MCVCNFSNECYYYYNVEWDAITILTKYNSMI